MYLRQHRRAVLRPLPGRDLGCLSPRCKYTVSEHGSSDESVSVHVFPQLKLLRGDQETVPDDAPGFGMSPRLGIIHHNTHTHTHVIMQRPLTAARTTSVSIRTVYHERPMALLNHGNQGESHSVVLRPPHEEPRVVSSRRQKQQEPPQHKVEAASAALTDSSSMERKRSDVVR